MIKLADKIRESVKWEIVTYWFQGRWCQDFVKLLIQFDLKEGNQEENSVYMQEKLVSF